MINKILKWKSYVCEPPPTKNYKIKNRLKKTPKQWTWYLFYLLGWGWGACFGPNAMFAFLKLLTLWNNNASLYETSFQLLILTWNFNTLFRWTAHAPKERTWAHLRPFQLAQYCLRACSLKWECPGLYWALSLNLLCNCLSYLTSLSFNL